jgi:hypothetical protein
MNNNNQSLGRSTQPLASSLMGDKNRNYQQQPPPGNFFGGNSDIAFQQQQAQQKMGGTLTQFSGGNSQKPTTSNQTLVKPAPTQAVTSCPYHQKGFVAYCMMHKELMCEECCDLSHHKDHNNQILLLKAAAQSFLKDVDFRLGEALSS